VAVVLVVLAVGLLQLAVYYAVRPPSPSELAQGQQAYQQQLKDYQAHKSEYEASAKECVDQGNPPEDCGASAPQLSDFMRTPTPFAEVSAFTVETTMFFTALAFLLVGASFIGAEYSSGALGNWLTFVPQRGRVYASKLLALLGVTALVSAVIAGIGLALAAAVTRSVGQPVSGVRSLLEQAGRGVVIAVVAALVGFGLALLTRHTIAATGVVLGYLLVTFVLQGFMQSVVALQKVKPFLPENNALAFLQHGYHYEDLVPMVTDQGSGYESVERLISFGHSVGYWGAFAVVVVALTLWVFRRRDVG